MNTETIVLAMGCFWGPEFLYKKLPGVVDTTVGYAGGHTENPNYESVCSGLTGHAEAIEVVFDPGVTSYREILKEFWEHHDPTTVNKQGPDVGEQYRAAIFYKGDRQKEEALFSQKEFVERHSFSKPIVTEIVELNKFYPAEEYHQDYADKHSSFVCHI